LGVSWAHRHPAADVRKGRLMTIPGVLDDQSLRRYRELLDAEDAAFDELEHACEEGDRKHFDSDFAAWRQALVQKLAFLRKVGIDVGEFAGV